MVATASDCSEDFDIYVVQINTGDGDGADMTIQFNGCHICASLFPSSRGPQSLRCESAVEDRLIKLLGLLVQASDDEYEKI